MERSWENRKVNGKSILPKIRDQGTRGICQSCAVAGAIESGFKQKHASLGENWGSTISVDDLNSRFNDKATIEKILRDVKKEGATTEPIEGEDPQRLFIQDFEKLQPRMYDFELDQLMVHVLSEGTAIGVFRIFGDYSDSTVNYFDMPGEGERLVSASDEDVIDSDDEDEDAVYFSETEEEEEDQLLHAVLIVGLGIDEDRNLFWKVLDSHSTQAGEHGMRRIGINLMKEAYIVKI